MAKLAIKSEAVTPFGRIFFILEKILEWEMLFLVT